MLNSAITAHRHSIVHDLRGQVLAEKTSTKQGSDWFYTHAVSDYGATGTGANSPEPMWSGAVGTSSGNLLYFTYTKNWKGGGGTNYGGDSDHDFADTYLSQSYMWREGAVQSAVTLLNRDGTSTSTYRYDVDGAPRTTPIRALFAPISSAMW